MRPAWRERRGCSTSRGPLEASAGQRFSDKWQSRGQEGAPGRGLTSKPKTLQGHSFTGLKGHRAL